MRGTEKQVSWAMEIKASIIGDVERFEQEFPGSLKAKMLREVILPLLEQVEEASWFIENRKIDVLSLCKISEGTYDMSRIWREYPELMTEK